MKKKHIIIVVLCVIVLAVLLFAVFFPRHVDYLSLAEQNARGDDLKKIYGLYKNAIRQSPDNPAAYEGMGKTIQRIGSYPKSLPYLEKACELDPGNIAYLENLFWGYFLNERMDDAMAVGKKLVDTAPDGKKYCSFVAEIYLMKAFTEKSALQQAEEYIKMADESQDQTRYIRGKIDFFKGDYHRAIQDLEAALKIDMTIEDAQDLSFLLALAYLRTDNLEKARESLYRLIALANCGKDISYWRSFPYPELAMLMISTYYHERFQKDQIDRLKIRFKKLKQGGVRSVDRGRTYHLMLLRLMQINELPNPGEEDFKRAQQCWDTCNTMIDQEFGPDRAARGNPMCFNGKIAIPAFHALQYLYMGDLYSGRRPVEEVRKYYEEAARLSGEDCQIKRRLESLTPVK